MTDKQAEQGLERAKYLLCWQIVPGADIIFGKDQRASIRALGNAFSNALQEIHLCALSVEEKTKYIEQAIQDMAALGTHLSCREMELAEAKKNNKKDDFEQFMDSIGGSNQ